MNKNKTEVILVLDRSGSMASIQTDVEGGLKAFIEKQRKEPGECFVSLYQFDTEYEPVFENVDIKNVRPIKVFPRGWTALHDAIGRTINAVGDRLSKTPEKDRPGLVIMTILSDGQENSSKEFTANKVKEMVKHQRKKYSWQFVFLGANQDAMLAGSSYGFSKGTTMTYAANSLGINNTFSTLSSGVSCMRENVSQYGCLSRLDEIELFSDEDRKAAMATLPVQK